MKYANRSFFLYLGACILLFNISYLLAYPTSVVPNSIVPSREFSYSRPKIRSNENSSALANWIRKYSSDARHRCGSKEDAKSAQWLKELLRSYDIDASLESFTFKRPYTEDAELILQTKPTKRTFEGMALLNAASTEEGGYVGKLGEENESGIVPVVYRFELMPDQSVTPEFLAENKREVEKILTDNNYPAVVIITQGNKAGLVPFNIDLAKPYSKPVILVSSSYGDDIEMQSYISLDMKMISQIRHENSQAYNVVGIMQGSDSSLKPLVIMVDRSSWSRAAGERGSGLAAWIYIARTLKQSAPQRTIYLVALTGQELGDIGLKQFAQLHPELLQDAYAWIIIGDNIAAATNPDYTFYSNYPNLKNLAWNSFNRNRINLKPVSFVGIHTDLLSTLVQRRIPVLAITGMTNRCFHMSCDRWPDTVSANTDLLFARTLAGVSIELSHQ